MQPMIAANMPTVSPHRDFRQCLANARRISAGVRGTRWVVIIAPDGTLVNVPVAAQADADQALKLRSGRSDRGQSDRRKRSGSCWIDSGRTIQYGPVRAVRARSINTWPGPG